LPLMDMGYVKTTLAPGEEYLYRAKFNWTYDLQTWCWFALGLLPTALWVYGFTLAYMAYEPFGGAFMFFNGAALALAIVILITRYVHKWTTVIAITSVRLIMKTGMVARNSHEVSLDKIEEVLMHQSFIGRLLGFGVLTIRGTGIAVIEFPVLARPMEIRREIETAVVRARGMVKNNSAANNG